MRKNYPLWLVLVLLFFCQLSQAQTRTVRGVLVDPQSGSPLPGASILVKGTAQGTTTDAQGRYELQAPVGATLVISFIGYTPHEVIVPPLTDKESREEKRFLAVQDSLQKEKAKFKTFHHTIPDSPEDKTLSPYFFVKSDNSAVDAMPLKSTSASVNISGVIAQVTVKQVYVNEGKNVLEALYIFPSSTRAAVYGLTMQVGKRRITAKIREKQAARQEYTQAVQAGKTATLLEQKRPNVFQMNVGNILPQDTITVELQYTELLPAKEGTYEFVYPTVVGPRYSEIPDDADHAQEKWVQNPYLSEGKAPDYAFQLKTRLNAGLPIQKVYCASHQVDIAFADKNTADINLAAAESAGGNRDFVLRYRLRGGQVESGLLLQPGTDENFFLLMLQPPDRPTPDQIPPREYVFIVDVSGSMSGFPLDVSKQLMRKLLGNLRPEDRFNVILFAGASNIYSEKESVAATEAEIRRAIGFIDRQQGSGSTSLLPALERALSLKGTENYARTFVLLTDGYVTVEKEAFDLVKKNLNQANLFAFGIGTSVNRYLMEGLAQAGMGEPFFAGSEEEAKKVGDQFREMIESPVLTNVRLDFGGLNVYDVEPASIPDVFAERPIIVFGKFKGTPQGTIRLSGLSGQRTYSQSIDAASARTDNNGALRYLWARERIRYWDDFAQFYEGNGSGYKGPHQGSQQKAITDLGLQYNLLTAYTSFIAVDSLIRTKEQAIEVKQPLPLPQGVSNSALSGLMPGIEVHGFGAVMGLTPDIKSLSEVVVVGYGTQTRRDLTGSVASIQSRELVTVASSIDQAMQGRLSGVEVSQNAGSPSSSTSVRIRGNSSVTLNQSPLYVVDGVVIDNSESDNGVGGYNNPNRLTDIAPEDIESIEVMKAGSSLYGSRGAQGVVLITTKSGRRRWSKHPKVVVSSSVVSEQVNKLPEVQQEFSQGRPIQGSATWQGRNEPFSWGPRVSELGVADNGDLVPRSTSTGSPVPVYTPNEYFRNGLTLNNMITMGHDKTNYRWYVGLGNQYRKGTLPGTDLRRNTIQLRVNRQLGKLKLDLTGWYVGMQTGQVLQGSNPSGVMIGLLSSPVTFNNADGYESPDGSPRRAGEWYDNPYWSSNKNRQQTQVNRGMGRLEATYDLVPHLQLQYDVQADRFTDIRKAGTDLYSAAAPLGRLMQRKEDFLHWESSLMLNYDQQWNDFNLTAGMGFTYRNTQRLVSRTDGTRLKQAGSFLPENALTHTFLRQNFLQDNRALLTRASLSWRSLVNLDLKMLNEWTSTTAANHLISPSVGISVQLKDLFAQNSSVISFGKVFTSFTGIQKEAPLFINSPMALARTLQPLDVAYQFERQPVGRTYLNKPESNATWELGTEWQFFNGRVSLQAVYYQTHTRNLYIPIFEEQSVQLQNGGSLLNQGWEADLNLMLLNKGEFTWNTSLHFTKAQTWVQSLDVERVALAGFQSLSSSLLAGQPYGVLYGTRYLRHENGQRVIGPDGFPVVDPNLGVLGNPNPNWMLGFENRFQWKGWNLSFLFDFRQGGVVWNGTKNTLNYLGVSALTGEERGLSQYIFEGTTTDGKPNTNPVNFVDQQDLEKNRWVRYGRIGVAEDAIEAASWLRLRHVSLTYAFGQNLLSRFHIDQLIIGLFAQNLWLSTPYSGIDPETNLTGNSNGRGLDYFNTPNTRSIGVSFKIGL